MASVPGIFDSRYACHANDPAKVIKIIDQQELVLLREIAHHCDPQTVALVLTRIIDEDIDLPKTEVLSTLSLRAFKMEKKFLDQAAYWANTAVMELILKRNREDRGIPVVCDFTVLSNATIGGVESWKTLIAHDRTLMGLRTAEGGTPVEHCVRFGHTDVLRFLLKQGAPVEDKDHPILSVAESAGANPEILALLTQHGASMDWK